MKIAVINENFDERLRERIAAAARQVGAEASFYTEEEAALRAMPDAEIVYGFAPAFARTSKTLRWLCLPYAGADAFMGPDAFANPGCLLTNSSGAYGVTIAEHMIMVTLMMLRQMPVFYEGVLRREWLPHRSQRTLRGSRVAVLGAGDIGVTFAKRLRAFEPASVTGITRSGQSREACFDRVLPVERLDEILPETDILTMSLPGTRETEGILSRERIALLPRGAYVVNVGRGSAVDEGALIEALNGGRLAGAALDVMHEEPLPADDPLWDAANILLTPHIAGNLTAEDTIVKNVSMFCEDLKNYASGRPLAHLVDRTKGY